MAKIPLVFFFFWIFVSFSNAQVYSYTNDTGGAPNSVASNCSATNLTEVNGATHPTSNLCGTGYSSKDLNVAGPYNSTLPAVEFTLTPASGYKLNLTQISAKLRRSSTGPLNARFAYSIGGGAFTDQGINVAPRNANCGTTTQFTWVFSSTIVVSSPSSITFRIYAFDASASDGRLQLLDITVSGSVAFPVELTQFDANYEKDYVALNWTTASERENDRFEIQHGIRGADFKTIGTVPGNGTSFEIQKYSFKDINFFKGYNYYRLKQVDYDGSFEYSPVVEVYVTGGENVISISPMPVSSILKARINPVPENEGSWEVYDLRGRQVASGNVSAGQDMLDIYCETLPPGMYLLQFLDARTHTTARFLKQ